jgi:LysR family carnitine catabolism transcriptional activator
MDLRRLSLFLAVVEHGSFTRAAAASYLSQPGLSQAIRELEAELGTPVFDRIGRRVTLTSAGEALVGYARQALADVDAGRAAVAAVIGLGAGSIALGCLPTLASDPTARLVGEFRRAHPGVRVQLAAPDDIEDLLGMLRSGVVELAVTEPPAVARGLFVHRLAAQDLVVALPPGSDAPSVLTLRQLASHALVVTPPGTSSRGVLDEALKRAGVEPDVAVQTAQREALVPLVLAGAGAALLPRAVAANAATMGAVIAETKPGLTRAIGLLHRESVFSPAAAAFWAAATGDPPPRT